MKFRFRSNQGCVEYWQSLYVTYTHEYDGFSEDDLEIVANHYEVKVRGRAEFKSYEDLADFRRFLNRAWRHHQSIKDDDRILMLDELEELERSEVQ